MKHFVFFHGIGIRSFFWESIRPLLDRENIRYSFIDLDFTTMETGFNSALNSVENIIKNHPDRDIILVGHSLGGLFAGYVAYKLGERIDKLIIVASGLSPQKKKKKINSRNRVSNFVERLTCTSIRRISGELSPNILVRVIKLTV